jgi:uncharacterized protein (DUF4415 family)
MKNKQSLTRRLKRDAMRREGKTYTQRMNEAIRTGKPVEDIKFVDKSGEAVR